MISDLKKLWRSFVGGEVAEEMYGRQDLSKVQTSLALCENFRVRPTGAVENCAGTQFVKASKNNGAAVLIPFIRGNKQALLLEFGAGYVRFHKDGGTVYATGTQQTILAYSSGNGQTTFTVAAHGYSVNDRVVLSGVLLDGVPMVGVNGIEFVVDFATLNSFTLQTVTGAALRLTPSGGTLSGGTVQENTDVPYELVTPYAESHLFGLEYAQDKDTLTITHESYSIRELTRVTDNNWTFTERAAGGFDPTVNSPNNVVVTATVFAGSDTALLHAYGITTVDVNGQESEISPFDFAGPTLVGNRLWVAGNRNQINWDQTAGVRFYNVYKSTAGASTDGSLYGFIGQALDAASPFFIDNNIQPDFSLTPPEPLDPFASAGNYPAAVGYFQQRRIFANTSNDPQKFWMTNVGLPNLLTAAVAPLADQAFSYVLSSVKANAIRHIVALKQLLFFTGSAVFRIFATNAEALTAQTVDSIPVLGDGCTRTKPVVARDDVLFANENGEHLMALRFSTEEGGSTGDDLSAIASHLIDGYTWKQMQFQVAPHPTWWGVRSDGLLVGLTYLPSQQVVAWQRRSFGTDVVESCAVVPEGVEDRVYLLINRTINGSSVRYIEFIHTRRFDTLADAFFVDCGLSYDGTATNSVSGLDHLEGETVVALVDGAVFENLVVTGGVVTLPDDIEGEKWHVGKRMTAKLKTLPLAYEAEAAGIGEATNISNVVLRLLRTGSGVKAGPSFDADKLSEIEPRGDEPFGSPPALKSGTYDVPVTPEWTADNSVCVQQDLPLPVTITAMKIDFAEGG
jgi:hypothetical protein